MRTTACRPGRGRARGAGAHRDAAGRSGAGSAGFTLVEYAVAMGIFAVIIGITMSGVTMMTRDVVKTTNLSTATDQIRQAFTRLDRQVRYARAINRPGKNPAGNRWYVDFLGLDATGAETCFQWRVDTDTNQLQTRRWTPGGTVPTAFSTVASDIANDTTTAQAPFTFVEAIDTQPFQGLDVMLKGRRTAATSATVTLTTSMTARNSSTTSQTNPDKSPADGVSDNPVCDGVNNRP